MKLFLRIVLLVFLVSGTITQELDLADAFDDLVPPTPAKPKSQPDPPKVEGGDGLDLFDALEPDTEPKPDKPTVNPNKGGGGSDGLDLFDALGPDTEPKPDKPAVNPNKGGRGGGGTLSDSDLFDLTGGGGGGGGYEPEGGRPRGGGGDPGYDPHGNADQPQEAGSGQIAGIVSAVGVALMGAASSYIAYQKKKLCFKMQGGVDPEKGQRGTHTEPQALSNLLQSN